MAKIRQNAREVADLRSQVERLTVENAQLQAEVNELRTKKTTPRPKPPADK